MNIKLEIKGKDLSGAVYKLMGALHIFFFIFFMIDIYKMIINGSSLDLQSSIIVYAIICIIVAEKAIYYFCKKNVE